MNTTWPKKEEISRNWHLIDLDGQILGRAATNIATLLIGKNKPERAPNIDCGDYVVVINSSKFKVTGSKLSDKKYYRHSGYADGLKEEVLADLIEQNPEKVVRLAVKNMLPKNKLRDKMMARLFIYAGSEHPHEAQKPEKFELKS